MVNRRYFLVIIDSSGRPVRRFGVSVKALQIAAGSAMALLAITVMVVVHGVWRSREAAEAEQIAHENRMLKQVTEQVAARLPAGRILGMRAELTFAQLYAKSGLGAAPKMLGVGPVEDEDLPSLTASDTTFAKPGGSTVLSVEPPALPLEFDRLERDGQELQTGLGEVLEYFHDAALLLNNTPSVKPVARAYLTSSFGKRHDPMNRAFFVMHKGVDLAGEIGTEITAPADGVVIFTGLRGGYGQTVVIDHGYGLQTHFAHLSRIRCHEGDRVHRGDLIANMGSTGRSTGPHLHYEVRRNGQPLNPLRFILD